MLHGLLNPYLRSQAMIYVQIQPHHLVLLRFQTSMTVVKIGLLPYKILRLLLSVSLRIRLLRSSTGVNYRLWSNEHQMLAKTMKTLKMVVIPVDWRLPRVNRLVVGERPQVLPLTRMPRKERLKTRTVISTNINKITQIFLMTRKHSETN